MKAIKTLSLLLTFVPSVLFGSKKEFLDYNFDGHDDYRVWRARDGRLAFYDIYLYSKETNEYEKHAGLSSLYNPLPKEEKKEIECFWPGGHASMIFTIEVYEWKENELIFKHVVQQIPSSSKADANYIRLTSTVVEGKPKIDKVEYIEPKLK